MSSVIRSLVVKIGADLTEFQKNMKQVSKEMNGISKNLSSAGASLTKGLTLPILGAVGALTGLAISAGKGADELITMANKTGLTVEALQEMQYAARFIDVEVETMTGSMQKLTKNMDMARNGSKEQEEAFKSLGIEFKNQDGSLRNAKDVWMEAIDALKNVSSEADRDALAMKLFGKSAAELNPLIKAGSAELNRYREEAHKVGAVMDDKTIAALGKFDDMMQKIGAVMKTATGEIGAAFLPVLEKIMPIVETKIIPAIKNFAGSLTGLIEKFDNMSPGMQGVILGGVGMAAAIGPVLSVLGPLAKGVSDVAGALSNATKALSVGKGLTGALTAFLGPAGVAMIAIAGIAAAIGLIVHVAGKASREVKQMTEDLIESYRKEGDALKAALDEAHARKVDSLNKWVSAEGSASSERLAIIQAEYDKEIASASKKEQALRKNLQERQSVLTDSHNNEIQRIRDEYGIFEEKSHSRTDLLNEQYDKDVEKATQAHNEKIALLDAEFALSLRLLDAETQQKIKLFQDQISAIDNKTKEEDRLEKERSNNQRILNLQSKIDSEKDAGRRKELQQEMQDFLIGLTRQKTLEGREIEKQALTERVEEVKAAADEQKKVLEKQVEQQKKAFANNLEMEKKALASKRDEAIKLIQEERTAKEEAENKKYNAAKIALDKEESALEGFAERYKEKLDAELAKKKEIEEGKLKLVKTRITAELLAEQRRIDNEKAVIDKATAAKANTAKLEAMQAELKKLLNINVGLRFLDPLQIANNQIANLEYGIKNEKIRLHNEGVPGFAEGVVDWRGGPARVNENGGEIRHHRPEGMTVIPHEVSMGISKAIGEAIKNMASFSINRNLITDAMSSLSGNMTINASMAGQATEGQNAGQPVIQLVFNSPIYGMLDFEQKVKQTVKDAARGGAFRGVLANG